MQIYTLNWYIAAGWSEFVPKVIIILQKAYEKASIGMFTLFIGQ